MKSNRFLYLIVSLAVSTLVLGGSHFEIAESAQFLRWPLYLFLACFFLSKGGNRKLPIPADIVFFLFILLAFVSSFWSIDPQLSLMRSASLMLAYAAIFLGLWKKVQDMSGARRLSTILLYIGLFWLAVGVFSPANFMAARYRGVFLNPNGLALYCLIHLPIAMSIHAETKKHAHFLAVLFIIANLALSGSRTSMAAALIAGAIFSILKNSKSVFKIFILVILLGFLFVGWEFFVELIQKEPFFRAQSLPILGGRSEGWQAGVGLIEKRPWFGYGYGIEDKVFEFFGIMLREHRGSYVGNGYLGLTLQLGVTGVFLFFAPLFFLMCKGFFTLPRIIRSTRSFLPLGFFCAIVGGLVSSAGESWPQSAGNSFFLVWWFQVMIFYRLTFEGLSAWEGKEKRIEPLAHTSI